MQLQTLVDIPQPPFQLQPTDRMLFVGSCFADNIGLKFHDAHFQVSVNPFGVMYNPVSILHTVSRWMDPLARQQTDVFVPDVVFFTLGTNHVYRLKTSGEIVDNCQKRPQRLFSEEQLSVEACAESLLSALRLLRSANPKVRTVLTVSPIRYRKYGYHGSQLSKAVLLLAVNRVVEAASEAAKTAEEGVGEAPLVSYFPAYEIINDQLRDYRFYQPDMLHPSDQAVDYIYERFAEAYFSPSAREFVREWEPIRAALAHRPFHPESSEYQQFLAKAQAAKQAFEQKWFPR